MSEMAGTGVFICRCGGNISGTVNCEEARDSVKDMEGVTAAQISDFLCSKPGLQMIRNAIQRRGLDRVVVACCSPHMHEKMFQNVVEEEGVNRYQLVHVNIREHCSWIHDKGATEKAVSLVKGGIRRAQTLEPLEDMEVEVCQDVMVVGGGVAGITAALQLSEAGYKINMVERNPSIGGRMAQLSKTFPTLDCAPCILSPRMAEVENDDNITLYTNAEVVGLSGGPGNFKVTVHQNAQGVDADKCLKCGRCTAVCSTEVPSEFEQGMYPRKAAYLPFPQAVPSSYTIDFENCTRCGSCIEACPADAIDLEDEDKVFELDAGSIVVATGFDLIDDDKLKTYHPEHPAIVEAIQVERLIENELTEGKVLTSAAGGRVKSVAYILCAGSRDPHKGVSYCSSVCCPYSIKQAILLKKFLPYLKIYVYYTDMRMIGRGFEDFYREAREKGIQFIHGRPGELTPLPDGSIEVLVEDIDTGLMFRNQVDIAVLSTAMVPSEGTRELASKLGIALSDDLFIASKHVKLDPISTLREGIYAAGVAIGCKDIHDSVIDARAAASHVVNFVGEGKLRLDPFKPVHIGDCDGCGLCVEICPRDAISVEGNNPEVEIISCNGCGACVSVCATRGLQLPNYTRHALLEEVKGLLEDVGEEIAVLGFFDDNISYTAADNAGTARLHYPTNMQIVRTPSTAILDRDIILITLGLGADGVMIWEVEESHEAELAEKLVEELKKELDVMGLEPERVQFRPMVLPIFKVLPKFISDYVDQIKKLGKIPGEVREKLLE
ncbi:MAG: hydrogenase iron-sulfur subunit [Candidatus Bathyarchaeota archaeon]|nr:MAG: hydrogenase iron-sulfur subunit [Candidatus Bathyarchaeota archaeon]